ncbi:hypothetical protein MYCTH_2310765 [Thermothelomyces thermophilus ATCC 42464]|uniref:Uncharacterized protein n=1 Tax=Thermothelomyces thermophilus (strain ATCC 42464 / BCRC 31852 / DSM 1799) TaxID=573729 RepID=G2QM08_THET4|nr:uncharacterized protein MYCTH_2310765 [Thermothelomyces thermophilus ATCC 42464]AEO60988.1 hypothetical protein MYCTH_2310765 [Thermothelomyces thermophilus ATCC 42464]
MDGPVAEDDPVAEDGPNLADAILDQSTGMTLRPRVLPSYRGAASSNTVSRRRARVALVKPTEIPRDCCPGVPPWLRLTLSNSHLFDGNAANQLLPFLPQLCRKHLQFYAKQARDTAFARNANMVGLPDTSNKAASYTDTGPPSRRRRASLSDVFPPKRLRFDTSGVFLRTPRVAGDRPVHDRIANNAYQIRALAELEQSRPLPGSHGDETNQLLRKLLNKAQHPNSSEALFCTSIEAARIVETQCSGDALIITEDQQPFVWGKDAGRPIEQFFRRFRISSLSVSVQVPSRPSIEESFEVHELREVKERFLRRESISDPWNVLDL